ncbi:MAG: hypothetical protein GC136_03405 [Alphaproteobacteria bacterium]|nr:hypothetical protein [Alphaproteobacteria bacterium]
MDIDLPALFENFKAQWLDVLWLPFAFTLLHKGQKLKAAGFVLACILTLRLQIELFHVMGATNGFTPYWDDMTLHERGFLVYGFFILAFMLLSYFSPATSRIVYFAASLTVYFMAMISAFAVLAI